MSDGVITKIQTYDPVNKILYFSPIKMIQARMDHKPIVYRNKLFVFGGRDNDLKPLNSVEMYSPETNNFVMMAPMKIARYEFGCCRVGNLVYVIGGYTEDRGTKSVEIYNLDNDTWIEGVDLPVKQSCSYACAVKNKLPIELL